MKLLTEISEKSLGIGEAEKLNSKYKLGKNVRTILKDQDGNIALQHISNHHYHKLPGGSVDEGEDLEEALKREVREEVGCDCRPEKLLGMIIEYRNQYELIQISYCFTATLIGEIGEPELEQAEIDEGLVNIWLPAKEALEKIKAGSPSDYKSHFILQREITYLEEYLQNQN